MNDNYRFAPLLQEIEYLMAVRNKLANSGPHLKILFTLDENGKNRIAAIYFLHRSRLFTTKLSRRGRNVVDFLAKHRHLSVTAAEIEAGMDEFYAKDGGSSQGTRQEHALPRRMVKIYIQRVRSALGRVFREAGLKTDPYRVLLTEKSETNRALYRLRCTAEWQEAGDRSSNPGSNEFI